ncbi:MAG: bifunctional DNA primase/polymerase [Armatimonadota bacterium]
MAVDTCRANVDHQTGVSSPSPAANPLLEAALAYAAQGWRVFPCKPRGKEPLTRNGCKAATVNAATIRKWWEKWPDANVAIATAGLLVVDTDGPTAETIIAGRDLPPAPTAHTGKGKHRFFRDTAGVARNKTGLALAGVTEPDQVDIRATGGYVIAAPSVHASGKVYAWAPGLSPADLQPPPAPQWLYDLQAPQCNLPPAATPSLIPEGKRNDTLTRLAGGLRADGLDQAAITAELLDANTARCRPPLREAEVRRIAASIVRLYPAAPGGPTVRVAKKLLRAGLTEGALALYLTRQALLQATGARPKQVALAQALGVKGLASVKRWTAELKAVGMDKYERPARRYVSAPVALLIDGAVKHQAKMTALHLLACADTGGAAAVGLVALAKSTGLDLSTVKRHLRSLREAGHLLAQVAPFSPELGRRERCNTYRFVATAPSAAAGLNPQKVSQVHHSATAKGEKVSQAHRESKPSLAPGASAVSPHAPQAHSERPFPTKAADPQTAMATVVAADPAPVPLSAPDAGTAPPNDTAKGRSTHTGLTSRTSSTNAPLATEPASADAALSDADLTAAAQALAATVAVPFAYVLTLVQRHGLARVKAQFGTAA